MAVIPISLHFENVNFVDKHEHGNDDNDRLGKELKTHSFMNEYQRRAACHGLPWLLCTTLVRNRRSKTQGRCDLWLEEAKYFLVQWAQYFLRRCSARCYQDKKTKLNPEKFMAPLYFIKSKQRQWCYCLVHVQSTSNGETVKCWSWNTSMNTSTFSEIGQMENMLRSSYFFGFCIESPAVLPIPSRFQNR